jgi:hypothetical protein
MTPDNLLQWRVEYGVVDFEVDGAGRNDPHGSPLLVAGPSESLDEMVKAKGLLDKDDVSKDVGGLPEPSFRAVVTRVVSEWICTPERGDN